MTRTTPGLAHLSPSFLVKPSGGRLATAYDLCPIHGGYTMESGFEPTTLRSRGRDLTTSYEVISKGVTNGSSIAFRVNGGTIFATSRVRRSQSNSHHRPRPGPSRRRYVSSSVRVNSTHAVTIPTRKARTRLLIRKLLIHILVVPPGGGSYEVTSKGCPPSCPSTQGFSMTAAEIARILRQES
ncbi:hypothetical protein AVEN_266792-1 [Araneus ventricosus]|uniref:Uncharacterized protein n=1 Tax=Araneus ventricosus TaxID=182803 RepID=A0A4Y2GBK8_ARAVE|nr:hypothetical protein AVEN_266792-1 [Araneus ventricosus]